MQYKIMFPSVVAHEMHTNWAEYLLPLVEEHFSSQNTNDNFYYNGRTTHGTGLDIQQDPRYAGFTEFIKQKGKEFLEGQGFDSNKVRYNPYFFLNSFSEGSSHPKHVHSQCTLSGIFYLQTPPGSSSIRFLPNQPFRDFFDYFFFVKDPENELSKSYYDIPPQPGLLLMWPAWLYHEVPPNHSTDPRISIVFNL